MIGLRDVRYAVRMLVRRPVFLGAAVFSIATGAGLNVEIYSVLRHVLFDDPLTSAAPRRIVRIEPAMSFPNYEDLRRFDPPIDLAAMQMSTLTWRAGDGARTLGAHVVSDNFFEVVGVKPLIGRTFVPADAGADEVVLSFPFWERILGAEPAVTKRSLDLNGRPYAIVGVLPKAFSAGPVMAGVVYVPLGPHVATALDNRRAGQFDVVGRIRGSVGPAEALAALRIGARQVERAFPEIDRGFANALTASSNDAFSLLRQGPAGRVILAAAAMLYGLTGLVLLVGCANVAGLMLVRADERRHEIVVRLALGATRGQLIQQVFLESLVIGVLGCVAGVTVCGAAAAALRNMIAAAGVADVTGLSASLPLGYSILLVSLVTLGCSLGSAAGIPRASRAADIHLRGRVSRRLGLQRSLVAAQIAVCFVLLVGAAVFAVNVARLETTNAGFDIDHVLSADVRVPPSSAPRDQLGIRSIVASVPGVESVSWGSPIGPPFAERLRRVGSEETTPVRVDVRPVGPRFFETMRMTMIRGRDVADEDLAGPGPRNVVVNETFVRRYLPGVEPIGQRFVRPRNPDSARPEQVLHITGVVRDSMARTIGDSRVPVAYVPEISRSLTIRVAHDEATRRSALQEAIGRLEPPGSFVSVRRVADEMTAALAPVRIAAAFLGLLAATAIALATTGLYALVSYVVGQRTFEIGVRVALGATRRGIAGMILRDAIQIVAVGCLFGTGMAWLVSRLAEKLIVGQALVAPIMFAGAACLLLLVGIVGSLQPARRAAGADPIRALRCE